MAFGLKHWASFKLNMDKWDLNKISFYALISIYFSLFVGVLVVLGIYGMEFFRSAPPIWLGILLNVLLLVTGFAIMLLRLERK